MIDHKTLAVEYFNTGYNCAQAVMAAFSDVTGLSKDFSARIASPYGGGMGRMREVCGAVSGMLMVTGLLYGYEDPEDTEGKRELYKLEQLLAGRFKEVTGRRCCLSAPGIFRPAPAPGGRAPAFLRYLWGPGSRKAGR